MIKLGHAQPSDTRADSRADFEVESSTKTVPQRRNLHGRHLGRSLRSGLKSLLAEMLPRYHLDLPKSCQTLETRTLFSQQPSALWLEIGFGAGEHLAWQAKQNPGVGILGAEFYVNGVASLLRRVKEDEIDNLRILRGDARDLLDVLPERSLDRVFVLFPDPWPKIRHHKRRIVQTATLDRLAQLMADGAELRLATDDMDYLRWMLERLIAHQDFAWLAQGPGDWRQRPPDWPPTRYEAKAIQQGRAPRYLRFRRCSRA